MLAVLLLTLLGTRTSSSLLRGIRDEDKTPEGPGNQEEHEKPTTKTDSSDIYDYTAAKNLPGLKDPALNRPNRNALAIKSVSSHITPQDFLELKKQPGLKSTGVGRSTYNFNVI